MLNTKTRGIIKTYCHDPDKCRSVNWISFPMLYMTLYNPICSDRCKFNIFASLAIGCLYQESTVATVATDVDIHRCLKQWTKSHHIRNFPLIPWSMQVKWFCGNHQKHFTKLVDIKRSDCACIYFQRYVCAHITGASMHYADGHLIVHGHLIVKSRGRAIRSYTHRISRKYGRHLGRDAAKVSVKLQNDWKSLN